MPFLDLSEPTLREVNELNRQFWVKQSELMRRRICDPVLYAGATACLRDEEMRGVSLHSRKTLEAALADAEHERACFQREYSRRGGMASKGDALRSLIQVFVRRNPKITERELFRQLKGCAGQGIIDRIDETSDTIADEGRQIHFHDKNGMPKKAALSGVKDRLSRVRAKINSR